MKHTRQVAFYSVVIAGVIVQIILYIVSFSKLNAIGVMHHIPDTVTSTAVTDATGVFFWVMGFVLFDQVKWAKWVRWIFLALCLLVVAGIIRLNIDALIGA